MINMLNKAVEVKNEVYVFALDKGQPALNQFWDTEVGKILNGGLYIIGTLAVIWAAFQTIQRFMKADVGVWKKIQPMVFAAIFATFCVQPELANTLISAFTNGITAIAKTITTITK